MSKVCDTEISKKTHVLILRYKFLAKVTAETKGVNILSRASFDITEAFIISMKGYKL